MELARVYPLRKSTARRSIHGVDGAAADQGGRRLGQQNRPDGVGHHGPRREIQGAGAIVSRIEGRQLDTISWRGHDEVMQMTSAGRATMTRHRFRLTVQPGPSFRMEIACPERRD